eukprot:g1105.t1
MASRSTRLSNNASPPELLKKIVGSASSNSISSLSSTLSVSPSTSPGSTENDYPIETRDNLPVTGRRKNLSSEEISKLLSTARIDRVNVETISKYIKENPLFDILNPIELNVVAGNFTTVSYQAGTIVFESMALMPDLYIVYEGELCCEVESNKFQRNFRPGDSISKFSLIKTYQVPVNIIAMSDVKCLLLRRSVFETLFKRFNASLKQSVEAVSNVVLGKEHNDIRELKSRLNKSITRKEYIETLSSSASILHLLPISSVRNTNSDEIGIGGRDQTLKDYNREEVLMIGDVATPMGTTSLFYAAFASLSEVIRNKLMAYPALNLHKSFSSNAIHESRKSSVDSVTQYHSDGEDKLTKKVVADAARRSLLHGDKQASTEDMATYHKRRRRNSSEMPYVDRVVWEVLQASSRK